jgi:hypothetical protein
MKKYIIFLNASFIAFPISGSFIVFGSPVKYFIDSETVSIKASVLNCVSFVILSSSSLK